MQTVLESLEQAYLNILNIQDEGNRDDNISNFIFEEAYCAKQELIKAICILVSKGEAIPMDKRVYLDLINTKIFKESEANSYKSTFLTKLYEHNILVKEKTIKEVIEILSKYGEDTPCYIEDGKVIIGEFAYFKLPKADYKIEE